MHKNLCILALVLLDQLLTATLTGPVRAIAGLLKAIRVSQNAKQQGRLSFVSEEQEFESCESSFPTLSQIGLPITKQLVSYLLREIVA
jgi:hypothetical protein